jgi:hypothetical protein
MRTWLAAMAHFRPRSAGCNTIALPNRPLQTRHTIKIKIGYGFGHHEQFDAVSSTDGPTDQCDDTGLVSTVNAYVEMTNVMLRRLTIPVGGHEALFARCLSYLM